MSNPTAAAPISIVAKSLGLDTERVSQAVRLLADGNTVPFIARYRKEVTGGLDEVQLRSVAEQHGYQVELIERRNTVLRTIDEQGKLSDDLRQRIESCTTKTELEDLYAPFRPKRRTRATAARERGLEPLAERILAQGVDGDPSSDAKSFVDAEKGVPDPEAALLGARDIVAERVSDDHALRAVVRGEMLARGLMTAVAAGKRDKPTKFDEYFDFREPLNRLAPHRYLALRRGEKQKVLKLQVELDEQSVLTRIREHLRVQPGTPYAEQLEQAIDDGYRRLLVPSIATGIHSELKANADRAAVDVFAVNLEGILLAPPLGARSVIGIDPGLRTGCKCAAVDATGKMLAHTTIQPFRDDESKTRAAATLVELTQTHKPDVIAIGNGTAGRETEEMARAALRDAGIDEVVIVPVNEAGASVYSASDIARAELPDIDVTIRGAVSIARRLQDPLAELVKIDPKSIGVGQYQHDVHQPLLKRKLDQVVESCVNRVGVDLETASAALLGYVAGVGPKLAKNIVAHRESSGGITSRAALREIPGVGERTFQQAAGFLRVRKSSNPLDASAVHPERYAVVETMANDIGVAVADLMGSAELVAKIDIGKYIDDTVGEPTLRDIVAELRKPGRDPRASFEPPRFRDDVNKIADLQVGMELEGVVTNVTAFGAFVDVGVHQDGLVHVSQLANRFVSDPSQVVKVGSRINVRVLTVDLERKRISLSARKPDDKPPKSSRPKPAKTADRTSDRTPRPAEQRPRGPRRDGDKRPRKGTTKRPERQASGPPKKPAERREPPTEAGGFRNNPFEILRKKTT